MSDGLRTPVRVMSVDEMADRIEELEAKLAKVVEAMEAAKGLYQVTHIHAALSAALEELKGQDDT
jgi:ribosomal protein L29